MDDVKRLIERRAQIKEMRLRGATLQHIGETLGLTKERVRQICASLGVRKPARVKAPAVRHRYARISRFADLRIPVMEAGLRDPYPVFQAHKYGASYRGIDFRLTFPQWWELWREHWHARGRGPMNKVMCRHMDAGAYEIGNVSIKTVRENGHERALVHRWTKRPLQTHAKRSKSQEYFSQKEPFGVYSED